MKLLVLCNEATVNKLIMSESYKRALSASKHMKEGLILGSIDSIREALNISAREPKLVEPLLGRLSELGVSNLIEFDAERSDFRELTESSEHLILGGFPLPEMLSWTASVLVNEKTKYWNERGYGTESHLLNVGKTEVRDDPEASFAQSMVTNLFHPNNEDKSNLDLFYEWVDEFDHILIPELKHLDFSTQHRIYWNVSGFWASLIGAVLKNKSYILTLRAINTVRQLGINDGLQHTRIQDPEAYGDFEVVREPYLKNPLPLNNQKTLVDSQNCSGLIQ